MVSPAPGTCDVAFKEWAGVCDAFCAGRQSLLIRKGGISEGAGPGGFAPEHPEFWLYPTWLHQGQQGLRAEPGLVPPAHAPSSDGSVPIRVLIRVELAGYVEREETLPALEELHVLTAETVRKRFHYRKPGLWILEARAWRHDPGFRVAATAEHAGCKTWVKLDQPLSTRGLKPVLDDREWAAKRERLQTILRGGRGNMPLSTAPWRSGSLPGANCV